MPAHRRAWVHRPPAPQSEIPRGALPAWAGSTTAAVVAGAGAVCCEPLSTEGSYGGPGLQQLAQILLGGKDFLPRVTLRLENAGGSSKGEVRGIDPFQV